MSPTIPSFALHLPLHASRPPASPLITRRLQARVPIRSPPICRLRLSPLPAAAYSIYLPYIFSLSSAHRAGLPPQNSLQEALLLSLNFDFVLPLSFPALAPVLHPSFEALFSFTVAYATLLLGFAADRPADNSPDNTDQSPPTQPYPSTLAVLLVPFLTNISWLPYLATRQPDRPNPVPPPLLLRISQSAALPLYSVAVALLSVPYCLFARADTFPPGLAERGAELARLVSDNVLANSFAVDCVAFALFQAWLVADDVAARQWEGPRAARAKRAVAFVPFFGLAWYLLERARDPAATKF